MDDDENNLLQKMQNHQQEKSTPFNKLAPFNPSSDQIQTKALDLLKLGKDDVLFDLGCGDGRLLCRAVETHEDCRCVGIEMDSVFVERARERIQQLATPEMRARIEVRWEDALKVVMMMESVSAPGDDGVDTTNSNPKKPISQLTLLDDATALYLFIVPKGIQKLLPILIKLVETRIQQKRPFRILSYMFQIHEWEPTLVDRTAKGGCPIYYYEWKA